MSKASPTIRRRRLNLHALAIVVVSVVVLLIGMVSVKVIQDRKGRKTFLLEARELLAKKQIPLALSYLNQYLELSPNDLEALELKGQVLADTARTDSQALEAVQILGQVLGRIHDEKRSRPIRRRLVKLNLMIPGRARSAEAQARKLIEGSNNPEDHRLLANVLVMIGVGEKNATVMDEARKEYEAAEAQDPGDVEGAEQLAVLYRERLDDPAKARQVLDKLVDSIPANAPKKRAAARLARARHFTQTREYDKAEADVAQATREDPENIDVRLSAAETALNQKDLAAARHHLAAIGSAQRDDLRIKVIEGLINLVDQRPEDAIQTWRVGLVKTRGNDTDLTWRLAHVLLESSRVAEAQPLIDQYRRLSGGETPVPRYRYLRGLSLLKTSRPAEAVTEFEAIRYKVDKLLAPHVYFALGEAYEAVRDVPKALDSYRQAAEISNDWTAPWAAVARLQAASASTDEAVATLRKGLAVNPNDARLLTNLAQVLWSEQTQKPKPQRDWSEVVRVLSEARKVAPGSVELALVESDYYVASDRIDDAIALLKTATGMNPKSPELWLARINCLARNGHLGDALDATEQAIAVAGSQAAFYITRASLLVVKGSPPDARKSLVDGLSRVPVEQRPLLWKTLGDFYQALKQYDSARAAFDEWARLRPESPEPRIALAELSLATGDDKAIAQAVDSLKKVGGPKAYYWRYVQVENLLRNRPKEAPDNSRDTQRLDQAETLINEIEQNDPQLALGYLLEGRLREKQKQTDKAITAYKKALKLNAGAQALNPLVALLVREGRDGELKEIGETVAARPGQVDRLAAVKALSMGNKGRAEQLVAQAVAGDPQGLDTRVWQAEVLRALGKPEDAAAALEVLIAQQPGKPTPWLQLLMLQISQRQTAKAAETIAKMRAQVVVDRPELLWAQCYRALGDIDKAGELYNEALRRWPNDPAVLSSAVTFYEQIGRQNEAEEALRGILRRDPTNGWATRKLALSLASRSGNRATWEEAVHLVGADPRPDDVPDDLITRASVFALSPDPAHRKKAVAILEGLLVNLPDRTKVHEQVARLLFASGDLARARDHAAKAAEGDKPDPDSILFYAGLLLTSNEIKAAEEQLTRLQAIDPDGLPVVELKARVLSAKNQGAEAAKLLEQAFNDRFATSDAVAVGEKMIALLATLNQPDAADRIAHRIAEISPRGRCVLAQWLGGHAKADEAVALLEEVAMKGEPARASLVALNLATEPKADSRWLELADRFLQQAGKGAPPSLERLQATALLRHLQRQYDKEITVYNTIRNFKPTDHTYLNNMAWTLSEEMNQPEAGLKSVDEAIALTGRQPQMLDTRGVILTRLARLDEAIRDLEDAANGLHDPSVYYHLARAYQKKGKLDESRKYRDLARKGGLAPEKLQRSEMADWDTVMKQ
ncbi:MAG: hypothetical protein NVSMB9_04370 [Isosphaeraceae bacterium]